MRLSSSKTKGFSVGDRGSGGSGRTNTGPSSMAVDVAASVAFPLPLDIARGRVLGVTGDTSENDEHDAALEADENAILGTPADVGVTGELDSGLEDRTMGPGVAR